jgi:hypothetical protein
LTKLESPKVMPISTVQRSPVTRRSMPMHLKRQQRKFTRNKAIVAREPSGNKKPIISHMKDYSVLTHQ